MEFLIKNLFHLIMLKCLQKYILFTLFCPWIYVYLKIFVLCGLRVENTKLLCIYNIFPFWYSHNALATRTDNSHRRYHYHYHHHLNYHCHDLGTLLFISACYIMRVFDLYWHICAFVTRVTPLLQASQLENKLTRSHSSLSPCYHHHH